MSLKASKQRCLLAAFPEMEQDPTKEILSAKGTGSLVLVPNFPSANPRPCLQPFSARPSWLPVDHQRGSHEALAPTVHPLSSSALRRAASEQCVLWGLSLLAAHLHSLGVGGMETMVPSRETSSGVFQLQAVRFGVSSLLSTC
jgi:hypothetical protein